MNPESSSAFLFDLDGVLIDSEREYTRIWRAIAEKFTPAKEEKDFALAIKGQTLRLILDTYFPGDELQQKVTAMLDELEQEMRYELLPGADQLLTELEKREIPRVLVTSSNDKKMAHLREELPGFEKRFNHIVTADMIAHSKPDPEGYLLGASLVGVAPEKCFVVEDSVQGATAGRNARATVIAVDTTVGRDKLKGIANIVISALDEIDLDRLSEINKQ